MLRKRNSTLYATSNLNTTGRRFRRSTHARSQELSDMQLSNLNIKNDPSPMDMSFREKPKKSLIFFRIQSHFILDFHSLHFSPLLYTQDGPIIIIRNNILCLTQLGQKIGLGSVFIFRYSIEGALTLTMVNIWPGPGYS